MNGESGRSPIVGRIAGGLLLLCGLTAAVAIDWRPMQSRDIGDRAGPPRRSVAEPRLALPARIEQCERYTREICGTWTLQANGTYRAAWDDGATGTIRVMELSGSGVVATRVDDLPRRLTAVYEGLVTERRLVHAGSVRWTTGHDSHAGSWTARWDPDSGARRPSEPSRAYSSASGTLRLMRQEGQVSIWERIRRLEGAELTTLHNVKTFLVASVADNYVRILPRGGKGRQRSIPRHQIEKIASLGVSREELRQHTAAEFPKSQNTSYIAALAFEASKPGKHD